MLSSLLVLSAFYGSRTSIYTSLLPAIVGLKYLDFFAVGWWVVVNWNPDEAVLVTFATAMLFPKLPRVCSNANLSPLRCHLTPPI
jgi:hypothetical protein